MEREQQQRERERREILHESKAAADAVNQHFEKSFKRVASQQKVNEILVSFGYIYIQVIIIFVSNLSLRL